MPCKLRCPGQSPGRAEGPIDSDGNRSHCGLRCAQEIGTIHHFREQDTTGDGSDREPAVLQEPGEVHERIQSSGSLSCERIAVVYAAWT